SFSSSAAAAVIQYTSKAEWQAAAGAFHTIDFTGFAHGTLITNQYTEQYGVTFVGLNTIFHSSAFIHDGHGLRGQPASRFRFDSPKTSVAVEFAGQIVFNLYYQGVLMYTSPDFWDPSQGGLGFAGIVSSFEFDEVVLYRSPPIDGLVLYDDLYFGVPSPGALGVFALTAFGCRRRRR
ncbi:MAG TPA: hypothetical protein PK400_09585, partial [Phycisphaerales bacterium]|nr:hypothetical protein [Phycisphaerales bacterium]